MFRRALCDVNVEVTYCVVECLEELDDEDAKSVAHLIAEDFPGEACAGKKPMLRVLITDRAGPPRSSKFSAIDLDQDFGDVEKRDYTSEVSASDMGDALAVINKNDKRMSTRVLQYLALLQSQPTKGLLRKLLISSGHVVSKPTLAKYLKYLAALIHIQEETIYSTDRATAMLLPTHQALQRSMTAPRKSTTSLR